MKKLVTLFSLFLSLSVVAQTNAERICGRLFDKNDSTVLVASHRGDWRNFPENSLEALQSAIDMGVDIVELDVRQTKDGHLILMHDAKLDRTTTGKGAIADTTLAYIQTLNLKNGCGIRTAQKVPTLAQALDVAKGKVLLNLDKADLYFEQIYSMLKERDMLGQIVMKGNRSPQTVKEKFGEYLDEMIYMPIVNLDMSEAEDNIETFIDDMHPVAFEMLFVSDDNPLPKKLKETLKGRALIWYNTLWDTMAGGHDDDATLKDVDNGWGYLIDNLGCRLIQTDRPAMLLDYLRGRGLHE